MVEKTDLIKVLWNKNSTSMGGILWKQKQPSMIRWRLHLTLNFVLTNWQADATGWSYDHNCTFLSLPPCPAMWYTASDYGASLLISNTLIGKFTFMHGLYIYILQATSYTKLMNKTVSIKTALIDECEQKGENRVVWFKSPFGIKKFLTLLYIALSEGGQLLNQINKNPKLQAL